MNHRRLLLSVIIFAVLVVILPRFNFFSPEGNFYKYPIHGNEWHSFTIAQSLEDNFFEPHTSYYPYEKPERFLDGSPLFHWIIYGFQEVGFSVDSFYILTLLQTTFLAVVFFLFLAKLLDPLSSFFSTVFALSLESSLRWFGVIFFSPFILSFSFFILCLYLLHKYKKINFLFILSSLGMILTYPPFVIALGIYLVSYYFFINKNISILITPLLLGLFTLLVGWFVLKGDFSMLVDRFIYFDYLTGSDPINLINYLGIPLLLLGFYGFYNLIKRRDLLPYNLTFLFFFMSMFFAIWPGYSFGFHYVRLFYIGCLLFMVYAGFGFYDLYQKIIKGNSKVFHKLIKVFTLILILLIISSHLNTQIKTGSGNLLFNNPLDEDAFEVLEYLSNLEIKDDLIVHPPYIGSILTPMTGFKVTALPEGLTGGLENKYYLINNDLSDCNNIEEVIKEENYGLLWLENKKDCTYLRKLFDNNSWTLYEYNN